LPIDRNKIQQQAEKLVNSGKVEAGIAQYQALVSDNPRDLGTLNKIGDLYVRLNKKAEAIRTFTRIAEIYSDDGFFLKAIAIFKKINKIDPTHIDTIQRLADLYAKQGLKTEARAQYLVVADAFLRSGQAPKALAVYEALAALEPENIKHRLAVAELKLKHGRHDEAARALLELAQELDAKGMAKESAKVYEMALGAGRGNLKIAEGLASALLASGQHEKALSVADSMLKEHPESGAMLAARGECLAALGRSDEAQQALRRVLAKEPRRADASLSLAKVLAGQRRGDEAHEVLASAQEAIISVGRGNDLLKAYEAILTLNPGSRPILESIFSVEIAIGNKAGSIVYGEKLAQAHTEDGEFDAALEIAKRLTELEPGAATHRARVVRIQSMADGGAATGPRSVVPPAGGSPKRADSSDKHTARAGPDQEAFEIDIDASAPIEDAEAGGDPSVEDINRSEAGDDSPAPEGAESLAREGAESLTPEGEEFISEHLTEAEVFVKYGLADRAAEQLQAIVEKFPWHVAARQRLRDVYLEEGNRARAANEAAALARLFAQQGDRSSAAAAILEAKSIDSSCPAIAEVEAALTGQIPARTGVGATAPSRVVPAAEDGEFVIEEEEEIEESIPVPASGGSAHRAAATARAAEPGDDEAFEIGEVRGGAEIAASDGAQPDEAVEQEVEAAPESIEAVKPSQPAAAAAAGAGGAADFFDLASELDASLFSAQEAGEEDAVLAGIEASPEGHSLDEIVSAFKKGIEQQVDSEDFETHYNLGIAYKEMGLMEEAIAEFQFASKDARLQPDCCSMLGICFREKGMLPLAVKWYQKGLEALTATGASPDDERISGVRFDLAEVLEQMGEYRQAMNLFVEVYGVDSRYRDVAARIKELEKRISA